MKLYLFDFDDTIINNFLVDYYSFKTILDKYDLGELSKDKLLSLRKKGMLAQDIFRVFSKDIDKYFSERKELLSDKEIWKHSFLNEGVVETFKHIKKNKDKLIIISLKNKDIIEYIAKNLNILKYIDEIYSTNNKVEIITELLDRFSPEECIFVSDDKKELSLISKLNVKVYCFLNNYENKTELKKIGKVISNLKQIL